MKKRIVGIILVFAVLVALVVSVLANDPASVQNPPGQGAYRVMSWMTDWSTRWDTNQDAVTATFQLLSNTNAANEFVQIILPYLPQITISNTISGSNTIVYVYSTNYVTNNYITYITNFVTTNVITSTNVFVTNNVTTLITNAGYFNLWSSVTLTNQAVLYFNMSAAQYYDVWASNASTSPVSMVLTNFPTTTNQAMVAVFNFRNGVNTNLNLTWNPFFTWVSQTGTIPPPTNILGNSLCEVSFFITPSTGNTNIVGSINP